MRSLLSVLFPLLLLLSSLFGKSPLISPHDVTEILRETMSVHATQKTFNEELALRSLQNFIEELDRSKTYFLKEEVAPWLNLSGHQLTKTKNAFMEGDFSAFDQIYTVFLSAIKRRTALEIQREALAPLESIPKTEEFKNLDWAESQSALITRLMKIHTLQAEAISKLEELENQHMLLQRIEKRRISREQEHLNPDPTEKQRRLLSYALKAMLSSLDSQTAYFTPAEAAQFMIQVQQRLFGIGAQLRDDLNGFTIVRTLEGGPAHSHPNIFPGDRIVAIESEPVVGMEITEVVELIRGQEGTPLAMTLLRKERDQEKLIDVVITRGEVVIQEARIDSKITPYADGVIATISLHSFYQDPVHSSCGDLYEEIVKLKRQYKLHGIILDLRQNSGGVLPQAVAVTGLFITKGIVCSVKDHLGRIEHLRDVDGKVAFDGPLVVLVSKASASAAEIVAQSLQDYGRALVVGDEHTFGKGTFQTFTLEGGADSKINARGEYKVTRGRYYTVSGKSPQLVGVKPDITVPGVYSKLEIGEKFTKYPLEPDEIAANFNDDLSDIPTVQRDQIGWLYRFNLQQKIKTYTRFLPILIKNSQERLESSPFYQNFLNDLENESLSNEACSLYAKSDPQHQETVNIIKDLILLLN